MQLVVFPPLPRSPSSFARVMELVCAGVGPEARVTLGIEPYRGRGLPGTRWQLSFCGPSGVIFRQAVVLEDERWLHLLRLDAPADLRARAVARMNEACAVVPRAR